MIFRVAEKELEFDYSLLAPSLLAATPFMIFLAIILYIVSRVLAASTYRCPGANAGTWLRSIKNTDGKVLTFAHFTVQTFIQCNYFAKANISDTISQVKH